MCPLLFTTEVRHEGPSRRGSVPFAMRAPRTVAVIHAPNPSWHDDRRAVRNIAVLVFAQAVLGSQLAIHIILGGLAGAALADDRSLATLPISVVVLVSMFTAPAASLLMGRYGRRAGFLLGCVAGGIGGALAVRALFIGSFELL